MVALADDFPDHVLHGAACFRLKQEEGQGVEVVLLGLLQRPEVLGDLGYELVLTDTHRRTEALADQNISTTNQLLGLVFDPSLNRFLMRRIVFRLCVVVEPLGFA
ncbi:hypothetical protein D3C77_593520 [compost metagenome]